MMKRFFLTLCLAASGIFAAGAQMRLTLDDAVGLALSENPTIRIAELEVKRYDYVKRQTWGNLIPQVSVGGTYSRSIIKQEMAPGLSFGADNTLTAQGDITWALFAPQVFRTLKLNDVQMASAVESARGSRIALVAEVKKAFFNILLAEQSLAVLRESEATIRRTVNDTQLQYDNGLASEYDLLTAQVQLSNLKPTIIQTETSVKLAKRLLKMYLSIPEEVEVEAAGNLDAMREMVMAGTDGLTTDVSENSDLRTLDLQEQLLTRQLRVTNAGRWPTLGAFFSATYTGNDMNMSELGGFVGGEGAGSGSGAGTAANPYDGTKFWWQHPVSAGFQLSIPIFAGLTKMNKSREIKNQIAQIGLQREYARRQIDVQVRSSLNDLLTAREKMYAQEHTVAQATKAYGISDTRYRAGAGTILELNSAQLAQTQAQLNYSQAIYDYLTSKAEYDKVIGREN